MIKLDKKNCMILYLLQEDCRMSLTDIAKRVGLSIDSVKKRIKKMQQRGIFASKIRLRPQKFGFPLAVDVKIKMHNYDNKKIKSFIDYSVKHPNVTELFSVSGEWDFTMVIIAKDNQDLGKINNEMRNKFSEIISDWSESLTTRAYKFEEYDISKLINLNKNKKTKDE